MNESSLPARTLRFIEFFGLCGVGKSTLLEALVPLLRRACGAAALPIERPVRPQPAAVRAELVRILAVAGVRAPWRLPRLLAAPEGWWLPRKLAYRVAGLRLRNLEAPALVADSGVLQPFVSFVVEENHSGAAVPRDALLAAVPLPACAVYVRALAATAQGRYVARQKAASGRLDERDLERRFAAGHAMCEELSEACRKRGVTVLTLDADRTPGPGVLEDLAASLAAAAARRAG